MKSVVNSSGHSCTRDEKGAQPFPANSAHIVKTRFLHDKIMARIRVIYFEKYEGPSIVRSSFKVKLLLCAAFVLLAFIMGVILGKLLMKDMPSVKNLENYSPPSMTRIFDDSAKEIFRFGQEKRILIDQKSIPPFLMNAIIATEDSRFYHHSGIDFFGIMRAALHNLKSMQRAQGGSTLTQQLARNLFLKPDKTYRRKIQEALLALQIEGVYTKEEILCFYCNQIYMGHGRFGIEAASQLYFGKSLRFLSPAEYAMLAGIIQRPEGYSPIRNYAKASARKNHVLDRMVSEGYLTSDEAEKIKQEKIEIAATTQEETNRAPYFIEEVRKYLLDKYGEETLYREGIDVYTTLDARLQQYANEAVQAGLEDLKKRHPTRDDAEAALIAIDPFTGEIKALVGGKDFATSEFDRAVQARRQAGSAFKPFVLAAALENGFSPSFKILDEPTVFYDWRMKDPYQPESYTGDYKGLMTLREIIEQSLNIPSVKLLNMVGYDTTIAQAKRMGITANLQPYPSMALGAFEVTLLNITSAFSSLPTGGIRMEPYYIREVADTTGTVREEAKRISHESLSEDTAFQMVWILKGVVESEKGTAHRASFIGRPLAGKTGTTNDYTDAWFIGFSPTLACGVWVGYDQKRSLGEEETGSRAALPIWIDFMSKALAETPYEEFKIPQNIVLVPIDRKTGLRAGINTGCEDIILEAFKRGHEPLEYCSPAKHFRASLPYQVLRFPITERNELLITEDEFRDFIGSDSSFRFEKWSNKLGFTADGKDVSLPFVITRKKYELPEDQLTESRRGYTYMVDGEHWLGKDGRIAAVISINEATQSIPKE